MAEPLTLRVAAVPGRTVFAVDEHGNTIPTRILGQDIDGTVRSEGELIAARKTPDGRIIADQEFYRRALLSGDLVEIKDSPIQPVLDREERDSELTDNTKALTELSDAFADHEDK